MPKRLTTHRWILATIIACVLGMITTASLTAQHYRIAKEGLMGHSFCTLSSVIDCDVPLTSEYAHLGNIPNSEIGFLFYAIVLALMLFAASSPSNRRSIFQFILVSSSIASGYALFMGYLLIARLEILCLLCIGSHILTLAIFCFALRLSEVKIWRLPQFLVQYAMKTLKPPTQKEERTKAFQYLFFSLALFGVGLLFFFGLNEAAHSGEPQFNRDALIKHFYSQEPVSITIPANRPSWGDPQAPITILDFSDFQCPFCRRAAFSLKPFLGQYRKEVRLVYLNYPLDGSCNPHTEYSPHPAACMAARAALCANKKDAKTFWKLHDLIFENQRRISRSLIVDTLAPQVGIPSQEMSQCLASDEIREQVREDIAIGTAIKVAGTPSIYINGRFLRSWTIPAVLRTIIDTELKRLRGEWTPPPVP